MEQNPSKSAIRDVTWGNGGVGYIANGKLYLERCGKCERENYLPLAASGRCAWCGDAPLLDSFEASTKT